MFKNKKKICSCLMLAVVMATSIVPFLTQAQDTGGNGNPPDASGGGNYTQAFILPNPFKNNGTILDLIKTLINDILLPIGAVIAVLMIMYAGFLYVTARGDTNQIGKAHDALKWAIIGAAILLGAWVISEAIQGTINQLKG